MLAILFKVGLTSVMKVPQMTGGNAPNTITTHLYFSLTVVLAQYKDPDCTLRQNAQQVRFLREYDVSLPQRY
jgi:hypothetical protein